MSENGNRKGIYQKILNVTRDAGNIPKNGFNAHFKYKFVRADDLTVHIRQLMLENGLAIIPSVISSRREGQLVDVEMEYILADVETGEELRIRWAGTGQDTSDKAVYKAVTGGDKYLLLKLFRIATGDEDPDDGGGQEIAGERPPTRAATPPVIVANGTRDEVKNSIIRLAKEYADGSAASEANYSNLLGILIRAGAAQTEDDAAVVATTIAQNLFGADEYSNGKIKAVIAHLVQMGNDGKPIRNDKGQMILRTDVAATLRAILPEGYKKSANGS